MKPVDQPRRQARDLPPKELERLKAAHARLREAVRQYDQFQGSELRGSGESVAGGLRETSKAQEEVRAAEDHLWRLRDDLLGWSRPEWAPRAATVSDWFSEEDQDYDQLDGDGAVINRGEIYLAPFPYANLQESKRRPVCLLSSSGFNVASDPLLTMVTSSRARLKSPGIGDVVVSRWRAAGLLHPSAVRTGKLLALEPSLLTGPLGAVSRADLKAVDRGLMTVLGL